MANSKGSSNVRNLMYPGKHALLPPKCPFPSIASTYTDYIQSPAIGSKPIQKPREGNTYHQRTSSESVLIEEQPSWLDDLLDEPETPVRRGGHRRSSSDSFAYVDKAVGTNTGYSDQDEYIYRNMIASSWACQEFDHHKDARHFPSYAELNSTKKKNRPWEAPLNARYQSGGIPAVRGNNTSSSSGSSGPAQEADGSPSTVHRKQDALDSSVQDRRTTPERKDGSNAKSNSETETKRAKQQFAQRSRVRKLQYIAELERNVQALQAEGSEVSAELEFLNQRNLILGMENKALKQRLESLAQEQLIKYLEHEVLEKEIGRLRAIYQLQQQQQPPQHHTQKQQQPQHHTQKQQQPQHHTHKQQQPSSSHRRASSRDLDSQFANLSL